MEFGESLKRLGKLDAVVSSIIWSTLSEIFMETKQIDIKPYLTSIQLHGDTIRIKTNKPLINSEILAITPEILERAQEKSEKIGINVKNFSIKCL